jgi:hypothetical protein
MVYSGDMGNTFYFSGSRRIPVCPAKRDEKAAKRFFKKSIQSSGMPEKVTTDKSGANKAVGIGVSPRPPPIAPAKLRGLFGFDEWRAWGVRG